MKLGLAIQTSEAGVQLPVALLSGSLTDKLAKAAAMGADGVDLMPAQPGLLDAASIRAALARHGLQAAAIGSAAVSVETGHTLLHPDALVATRAEVQLAALIDFAAAVGAPLVTIGSFRGRADGVGPAAADLLGEALRRAADRAIGRGVRLALEPLNRYEADLFVTVQEGLDFLERLAHPAVGLVLDTFHMAIEEASWEAPIQAAADAGRLWHIHLGDNNRRAPGWGMLDFGRVVEALDRAGYQGFLSAELLACPDPDSAARQALAHMRPLLEAQRCD